MSQELRRPQTQLQTITIRPARAEDVAGIVTLVNEHALRGALLPRTTASVYETLHDWFVADAGGDILGCVSLMPYASGRAEVRSLAIRDQVQGLGIGRRLLTALVAEAKRRQVPMLFALTRAVGFFIRVGFTPTNRSFVPEKLWRDCRLCPLNDGCDELAVALDLEAGQAQVGVAGDAIEI